MEHDTIPLNNGVEMPLIGFGTWKLADGDEAYAAVLEAIKQGYRLIDTAKIYGNEVSVGRAIKDSGIAREELFVTTKLWNDDQGYETALTAFDESLARLGLQYIDLYLVHWPARDKHVRIDSWRALESIYQTGQVRAIGVSNYTVEHLSEITGTADTTPAVNQVEFNPFVFEERREVLDFCADHGILLEAYSPLAQAGYMDNGVLTAIAEQHGKSPSQVLLRWALQHMTVPIPKATSPDHIKQNFDVFDFELTGEQMSTLNQLG